MPPVQIDQTWDIFWHNAQSTYTDNQGQPPYKLPYRASTNWLTYLGLFQKSNIATCLSNPITMNVPQHLQNSKSFLTILALLLACLMVLIGSLSSIHTREHNIYARRLHETGKSGCGLWHPSDSSSKTWCVSLHTSYQHYCCNLCSLTCYRLWILFAYSHHISTNDVNYPLLWNTLSKEDKARLFHKSKTDCCMDHFLETVNCRIIDHCSSTTWSMEECRVSYERNHGPFSEAFTSV